MKNDETSRLALIKDQHVYMIFFRDDQIEDAAKAIRAMTDHPLLDFDESDAFDMLAKLQPRKDSQWHQNAEPSPAQSLLPKPHPKHPWRKQ